MKSPALSSDPGSNPVRHRILEAAGRIVTTLGAAHLSLDLVAEMAAVSKGGLLYHFHNKESLLTALTQWELYRTEQCIEQASEALGDVRDDGRLKARIIGLLGNSPRARAFGPALLGTFGNTSGLLEPIRDYIASESCLLTGSTANFSCASIVTLAIDGLILRESLGISSFTKEQRAAVVDQLMRLADEACRGSDGSPRAARN
jgi:AcrR family transcriptional regulator